MATKFDVTARLAEARQAVDNTQSYVWATHLLGYQNPDLTLHSAQIRDWFSSEDGMDLRVLDADGSAVQAVATVANDVAARQRDQLAALTAAWQGDGAASAEEFLRRHSDAGERVAASARTAAQALAGLRDALWQIVDTKVATAIAIDDSRRTERPAWLAAAQTVTTGAGDRSTASELVDRQVKPFVDNDIRNGWLTAMHTAMASISSSYDAATAGMTSAKPVRFDVPGEFGPEPAPPVYDEAAPRYDPAPAAGAATSSSSPASPAEPAMSVPAMSTPAVSSPAMSSPAIPATPTDVPTTSTAPTPAALPTSPSGGLDGLGQGFGEALRGLLPSPGDGSLPDMPDADVPTLDDPPVEDEPDDKADESSDENDEKDCDPEDSTAPDDPIPTAVDDAAAAETPSPAETPPPPEAPAPPPEAAPPEFPAEAPVADTATPCEIAADELPQAGT